jgi:hypothetical protein
MSKAITLLTFDKPSTTGAIYTKEVVEAALDDYYKHFKYLKIVNQVNPKNHEIILEKDIVAFVKRDHLSVTKKYLKLKDWSPTTKVGDSLRNLLDNKLIIIAPFGIGDVEDDRTVSKYSITGLQIAPKGA